MSETQEAPPGQRGHRTLLDRGSGRGGPCRHRGDSSVEAHETRRAAPPQVVKVAKAALGDMPETLSELGTVSPVATVTVLPQLSGYLTEVGYKEGQDVKKGQFLAQIDPRQYEIDLQQAQAALLKDQASLDQARSDLARYHQLRDQKAIAEQTVADQEYTVKQDEAQVKSDEANIAQYKLDLIYCHITAPVAGRVGLRLIDPGNYVTASSSPGIVVITTMKPTTVQFTVAQNDLAKVIARVNSGRAASGHRLHERQQPGDRDRHALRAQQPDGDQHRHRDAAREFANETKRCFRRIRQHQDPGRYAEPGGSGAHACGAERRPRRLRLSGQLRRHGVGAQGRSRPERWHPYRHSVGVVRGRHGRGRRHRPSERRSQDQHRGGGGPGDLRPPDRPPRRARRQDPRQEGNPPPRARHPRAQQLLEGPAPAPRAERPTTPLAPAT